MAHCEAACSLELICITSHQQHCTHQHEWRQICKVRRRDAKEHCQGAAQDLAGHVAGNVKTDKHAEHCRFHALLKSPISQFKGRGEQKLYPELQVMRSQTHAHAGSKSLSNIRQQHCKYSTLGHRRAASTTRGIKAIRPSPASIAPLISI